jgi:two-component system response regulator FixJ
MLAAVRAALAQARAVHDDADGNRAAAERSSACLRFAGLSPREREVLEGLVAGNSNKLIARNLGISPRTVEVYRANLMTKTQATSLSHLVRLALTAGVMPPGDPSR